LTIAIVILCHLCAGVDTPAPVVNTARHTVAVAYLYVASNVYGALNMDGNAVSNLPTPRAATEAANKSYVDNANAAAGGLTMTVGITGATHVTYLYFTNGLFTGIAQAFVR